MTKWIRADHARAEKEAAVAAAYEDAAEACIAWGKSHGMEMQGFYAAEVIRARANPDPLAARDARVRDEALREAAEICAAARDKRNKQRNNYPEKSRDVKQRWMAGALQSQYNADAILALIPTDQEGEG